MNYPTAHQVENASKAKLGAWLRFLPSPGMGVLVGQAGDTNEFQALIDREQRILKRIQDRFDDLGGWTPALSKLIGWAPHGCLPR